MSDEDHRTGHCCEDGPGDSDIVSKRTRRILNGADIESSRVEVRDDALPAGAIGSRAMDELDRTGAFGEGRHDQNPH